MNPTRRTSWFKQDHGPRMKQISLNTKTPAETPWKNASTHIQLEALWRMNPVESFSDWTILIYRQEIKIGTDDSNTNMVKNESLKGGTIYHVHKLALACGPRISQVLADRCRRHQQQPSDSSSSSSELFLTVAGSSKDEEIQAIPSNPETTTRLFLDDAEADSFPVLLDFLYTGKCGCLLTSSNAAALFGLADRLKMPQFVSEINQFMDEDISAANLHVYYNASRRTTGNASATAQAIVLEKVTSVFASQINQITPSSPILTVIDPHLLQGVLWKLTRWGSQSVYRQSGSDKDQQRQQRDHLCQLVMSYCRTHQNSLTETQLHRLTDVL